MNANDVYNRYLKTHNEQLIKNGEAKVEFNKLYPDIKGYPHCIVNELLQELIRNYHQKNEISIKYSGSNDGYFVMLNGEEVHFAKERYEADMFKAELKAKLS